MLRYPLTLVQGYCGCDFRFKDLPPLDEQSRLKVEPLDHLHRRTPVGRCLGPAIHYGDSVLAEPIADQHCYENFRAGFTKRVGRKLPKCLPKFKRGLRDRARKSVRLLCNPIPPGELHSFRTWIVLTHYSLKVRDAMVALYDVLPKCMGWVILSAADYVATTFGKKEFLSMYKPTRLINPLSDKTKFVFGPIFKSIEEEVYKLPMFVKHIPRKDLAEYIANKLSGDVYVTDYTSFESLFVNDIIDIEWQWYSYLLKNYPYERRLVHDFLFRRNKYKRAGLSASTMCRRLSGSMNTSLGNCIANYVITTYLCKLSGFHLTNCVFEGDDGVICGSGKAPSSDLAAQCGLLLKIERRTVRNSSFCGMIFDPSSLQMIKDPLHTMLRFGWTLSNRMWMKDCRPLLVAKAYSLLYELPACPVLSEMARTVVRKVKVDPIFDDDYWTQTILRRDKHDQLDMFIETPTRELFSSEFGVPIDMQLRLEEYFRKWDGLAPLKGPLFEWLFEHAHSCVGKTDVLDFSSKYVRHFRTGSNRYLLDIKY